MTEPWQRGPVDGVPSMLQPVAHMLQDIGESVPRLVDGLTEAQWNARPADIASVGFHVRHVIGVLDRLFTYARGEALSEAQFAMLKSEQDAVSAKDAPALLRMLQTQVDACLAQLRATDPASLGDFRAVGRAQLPSTVIGCLTHGAEHSMRHLGQLSVTVRVVSSQ
jgi:uncharacterized damage-inducible protein DinB